MTIRVIDFYQRKKNKFPNKFVWRDPVLYVLAKVDGKLKEMALRLAGDIKPPSIINLKDFEAEAYCNFVVITNALLSDMRENIRQSWKLSERDFKDLIFDMYCIMVSRYCTCGFIRRFFLYLAGVWKYYFKGVK